MASTSTKAHGKTPESKFGKTREAVVVDRILKIMHRPAATEKFQDPKGTVLRAYKILAESDGQTSQHWFNTYQQPDGEQYVGEKIALDSSGSQSLISEADFDARCAEKGYVPFDGDCPPQIVLIGVEVEEMA